jgi:hypothetical protein
VEGYARSAPTLIRAGSEPFATSFGARGTPHPALRADLPLKGGGAKALCFRAMGLLQGHQNADAAPAGAGTASQANAWDLRRRA